MDKMKSGDKQSLTMGSKILVVGSCMLDYTSYASRLPKRGETLKGTAFMTNQGGKGANQCMAAAKLGGDTSLIARLGDDHFGLQYLNVLKSYNVDIEHTHITEGITSGVAQIMVDETAGENIIVIVPGANNKLCEEDLNEARHLFETAKVLVCQLETPIDVTLTALRKFQGISILNAAPATDHLDSEFLCLASIFCVNETEAALLTGLNTNSLSECKLAVTALLERGCNIVILTIGERGALLASKEHPEVAHISVTAVSAVDTTGAGDAFVGSLAYLIAEKPDMDIKKQVSIACQLAAYSVKFSGTHKSYADERILLDCLKDMDAYVKQ